MNNINKTNRFFKEKVYSNLTELAFSPVSWTVEVDYNGYLPLPNIGKLLLGALLAPVLVPATAVTSAIALCLAGIAALFHGLSLAVAGIMDACEEDHVTPGMSLA